jgi:hypothetical protein
LENNIIQAREQEGPERKPEERVNQPEREAEVVVVGLYNLHLESYCGTTQRLLSRKKIPQ